MIFLRRIISAWTSLSRNRDPALSSPPLPPHWTASLAFASHPISLVCFSLSLPARLGALVWDGTQGRCHICGGSKSSWGSWGVPSLITSPLPAGLDLSHSDRKTCCHDNGLRGQDEELSQCQRHHCGGQADQPQVSWWALRAPPSGGRGRGEGGTGSSGGRQARLLEEATSVIGVPDIYRAPRKV